MTSEERKEARYQRRKASRQRRREERLKEYDDFDRVKDANNLITAFKKSKSGVDWKASVQRYEMNLLRNINNTVKALESGENVSQGFIVFWLCERGKTTSDKECSYLGKGNTAFPMHQCIGSGSADWFNLR